MKETLSRIQRSVFNSSVMTSIRKEGKRVQQELTYFDGEKTLGGDLCELALLGLDCDTPYPLGQLPSFFKQ
jgi:hypothetical protein